jgi:hypothetical protein
MKEEKAAASVVPAPVVVEAPAPVVVPALTMKDKIVNIINKFSNWVKSLAPRIQQFLKERAERKVKAAEVKAATPSEAPAPVVEEKKEALTPVVETPAVVPFTPAVVETPVAPVVVETPAPVVEVKEETPSQSSISELRAKIITLFVEVWANKDDFDKDNLDADDQAEIEAYTQAIVNGRMTLGDVRKSLHDKRERLEKLSVSMEPEISVPVTPEIEETLLSVSSDEEIKSLAPERLFQRRRPRRLLSPQIIIRPDCIKQ